MNLGAIREALADKVRSYVSHAIEVKAYDGLVAPPLVRVLPGSPYVVHWGPGGGDNALTFGADGLSEVNYVISIVVPHSAGSPESSQMIVDRLLSIGDGEFSSLFDAVMESPRTLGGLVEDVVAFQASSDVTDEATSATVEVLVLVRKGGAQV